MGYNKNNEFRQSLNEGLIQFLQEEGYANIKTTKDLNNAKPVHKGKAFLKYYLWNFFNKLNDIDEDLLTDDYILDTCITDGKDDKGCDFILIDGDDVYIVQAKYGYTDTDYIEALINLPNNILTDFFYNSANNKLKSFISDIKRIKNPIFKLIYLTSETIDSETKNFYTMKKELPNNIELMIKDFSELRQDSVTIKSSGELPPESVDFVLGQEDFKELDELDSKHYTILITQKGTKIKQLYNRNDCRERLFNYNIRSWLGRNIVNKSMEDTIKEEPENFFYYNNGVTGICESFNISTDNKKLTCKKLQIINGAQTVTTIAKYPDDDKLSKVKVLIRIIAAGEYGKSSKLIEKVVTNNNNQTVIQLSDFRSNDPIQIQIERKFIDEKLKYRLQHPSNTALKYKRKRMQTARGDKYIQMKDLGKCYYSAFFNPHQLNESIKKLWDINSETGLYNTVYGVADEILTDEKFYKLLGSYYISEYIKIKLPIFKQQELDKKEIYAEKFKYHILWGIVYLLRKKYADDIVANIIMKRMISKGSYILPQENENKERNFYIYFKKVVKAIEKKIEEIQNDKKENDEPFVIRNYQRDSKFTNKLKLELDYIDKDELPELVES